jgi:PRC-barrel domain
MLNPRLFACAVVFAVTVAPACAQDGRRQPPVGAAAVLIGLPVYTSDGREIGHVTEVVSEPQEPLLIAEIERPVGFGPRSVAIPIDVFVQRADRIELTLTLEQVSDRLAGPEPER